MRLPRSVSRWRGQRACGAGAGGGGDGVERVARRRRRRRPRRCSQRGRAFVAEREGRGDARCAPRASSARAVSARKGWASRKRVFGPTAGSIGRPARRAGSAPGRCRSARTARANWSSTTSASAPTTSSEAGASAAARQPGHQRGQAGVLALGEGGLDAAAGVVEHPHAAARSAALSRCGGARQVELDHLGRAGADQEQHAGCRGGARAGGSTTRSSSSLRVGQAGQIALVDDGGGEARLGEDHHAGGRLDQVRAGARADDEEEGVLHLAVQPDDAGQAAEHLALAALAQHRRVAQPPRAACGMRDHRRSCARTRRAAAAALRLRAAPRAASG